LGYTILALPGIIRKYFNVAKKKLRCYFDARDDTVKKIPRQDESYKNTI
jgi:hypothetical protein